MKDNEFTQMRNRKEREREEAELSFRREERPILEDLRNQGVRINSIQELVNRPTRSSVVVGTLLNHLPKDYPDGVKEAIVRALTVSIAKGVAARPLLKEYEKTSEISSGHLRWAIANALSVVADKNVFEELVAHVKEKSNGKSREMLVCALGNLGDARAIDILTNLLDDEELAGFAIDGLVKLKVWAAKGKLETLQHSNARWIRDKAKRALKRLS